jgi:hypothetical protein
MCVALDRSDLPPSAGMTQTEVLNSSSIRGLNCQSGVLARIERKGFFRRLSKVRTSDERLFRKGRKSHGHLEATEQTFRRGDRYKLENVLHMQRFKDHTTIYFCVPKGDSVHTLNVKNTLDEIHAIATLCSK